MRSGRSGKVVLSLGRPANPSWRADCALSIVAIASGARTWRIGLHSSQAPHQRDSLLT